MKRLLFTSLALSLCAAVSMAASSWAGEITGTVGAVSLESVSVPGMAEMVDRVSVVVRDSANPEHELTLHYPLGHLGADTALGMVYKQLMRTMPHHPPMMGMGYAATRCPHLKMMMAAKAKCAGKLKPPCAKTACASPPWGAGKPVSFAYDDASMVVHKTTFWAKKPCCASAEK